MISNENFRFLVNVNKLTCQMLGPHLPDLRTGFISSIFDSFFSSQCVFVIVLSPSFITNQVVEKIQHDRMNFGEFLPTESFNGVVIKHENPDSGT